MLDYLFIFLLELGGININDRLKNLELGGINLNVRLKNDYLRLKND